MKERAAPKKPLRGFVEQQVAGFGQECACKGQALLFSPGERFLIVSHCEVRVCQIKLSCLVVVIGQSISSVSAN